MEYQETGNKIPISAQELVDYVKQQLAIHDASIASNQTLPDYNPYTHPVIYKTKDGKTIMIPDEIQKQAVSQWHDQNGTNVPVMQQVAPESQQNRCRKPAETPYHLPRKTLHGEHVL